MKSAIWLAIGTALGFVVAHVINATPAGAALFADIRATASRFSDAVVDGYRSRESELGEPSDVSPR